MVTQRSWEAKKAEALFLISSTVCPSVPPTLGSSFVTVIETPAGGLLTVVSSPAWILESAPPPTLYVKVSTVFVGVSPKLRLFPIVEPIAPGISATLVPFIVTPNCSTGSTCEPELLNLNNPLPNWNLYVWLSSSNLLVNFLSVLIY